MGAAGARAKACRREPRGDPRATPAHARQRSPAISAENQALVPVEALATVLLALVHHHPASTRTDNESPQSGPSSSGGTIHALQVGSDTTFAPVPAFREFRAWSSSCTTRWPPMTSLPSTSARSAESSISTMHTKAGTFLFGRCPSRPASALSHRRVVAARDAARAFAMRGPQLPRSGPNFMILICKNN